jgi:hypothetical protein
MVTAQNVIDVLTPGLVAARIGGGLLTHHVARMLDRGEVPFSRCGRIRLIQIADLDRVREVAQRRGYLRVTC